MRLSCQFTVQELVEFGVARSLCLFRQLSRRPQLAGVEVGLLQGFGLEVDREGEEEGRQGRQQPEN
jgi:hypothetical protein